jgi:hypothetical protein
VNAKSLLAAKAWGRATRSRRRRNEVLGQRTVIDVGGTSVKILATGQSERRSFSSGPTLTPRRMISEMKKLAGDWGYDVASIGYPGLFSAADRLRNHITQEVGGSGSILVRHLVAV